MDGFRDGLMATRNGFVHSISIVLEAINAITANDITKVLLVLFAQWRKTSKTLSVGRFLQRRIQSHAVVEYKTFPLVVGASATSKVIQNPAIELEDVFEPAAFHERSRFFTPDSAGTEQ